MQIIDKSLSTVKLLFTLTETTSIVDPFYLLVLQSPSTNKTYRFILPANTTEWTERIDVFLIDGVIFNDIEIGRYYYSAYQNAASSEDELTMGEPIEVGLINVIDTEVEQYTTVEPAEETDDFIIYNE